MASSTHRLCQGLIDLHRDGGTAPVEGASKATLFNVLGTAIAGSRSDAVEIIVGHGASRPQPEHVAVPARSERLDALHAALAIGTAAHVDDFDDTHLVTVIHPGAATMASVLTLGEQRRSSGSEVVSAFALGCEAQLRIGRAMSPSHYDAGWHITGTCGVLGATVAAGLLLELDLVGLEHAIGIAATQTLGTRAAFGTMTKPFHPGKAAGNGLLSAVLAERGFTGPQGVLDGEGSLFAVMAEEFDPEVMTSGLGETWELHSNTFKPYPCGIVSHPAIDAAVMLHSRLPDGVASVARIVIHSNPLVPELTGNKHPLDGLEARFSTIHGVVVGLMDGTVGLAQYADERVRDQATMAMRERSTLCVSESLDRDAAAVEVQLSDGTVLTQDVPHARGSLARPLSDAELFAKVDGLVSPVLPGRTPRILEAVHALPESESLDDLLHATASV